MINERQIDAFRATARAGTVSGAAATLHVSQPAVSRLLANLQHGLDFKLFDRRAGRLQLTSEGQVFLREVERHFVGIDALQAAARRIAHHGTDNIRVLGIPSVSSGILPWAVRCLLAEHPHTMVTLDTDTTDRVASQVESGQFDVGFATDPVVTTASVDRRVIASRPWFCVFPPEHDLADRSRVRLKDIAAVDLVGFSPGMSLRTRVDQAFQMRGLAPNYVINAQTIESICALVAHGCGGAVIHPYAAHVAHMHGLKAIELTDTPKLDLVAITPSATRLSRLGEEFVNHAAACAQ